ncbi:hypothetical protein CsSME_00028461 [Camellia sinensis var. sinensis]
MSHMSGGVFYNSRGERITLVDLNVEMNQASRSDCAGTGVEGGRDRRKSPGGQSNSPRRDERSRSPRAQMKGSAKL